MTRQPSFTERDRPDADATYENNPERVRTDKMSIYDLHEDMQTVDAIPLDVLGAELQEEAKRHRPKNR